MQLSRFPVAISRRSVRSNLPNLCPADYGDFLASFFASRPLAKRKRGGGRRNDAGYQPPHAAGAARAGPLWSSPTRARVLEAARSPSGVLPRLSPGGLTSPKAQLGPGFVGWARHGRCPPSPAHFQRCTSRAGHSAGRLMPEPPGNQADEARPAGTALAPDPPASPAGVLDVERASGWLKRFGAFFVNRAAARIAWCVESAVT
jgi:hypothetical protein